MVLSQQGSQIASLFGPGGAIAGALLAFGSIAAGSLFGFISSTEDAEEAANALEEAVSTLDGTMVGSAKNVDELREKIARLGEEYQLLAEREAERGIEGVNTEITNQRQLVDDAIAGFERLREFTEARVSLSERNNIIPTDRLLAARDALRELQSAVDRFRDGGSVVGISTELRDLQPTFDEFGRAASASIAELVDQFDEAGNQIGEANLKLSETQSRLDQLRGNDFQGLVGSFSGIQGVIDEQAKKDLEQAAKDRTRLRAEAARESARAAAELEQELTRRREVVESIELQAETQARLLEAQRQGSAAAEELTTQLAVERNLRKLGADATDAEREAVEAATRAKLADAEATKALANAQAFLERQRIADNRPRFDRGFDPTRVEDPAAAGAREAFEERRRQQEETSRIIGEQFAADVSNAAQSFARDVRLGLIDGAEDAAQRFANIFASIPERAIGAVATSFANEIASEFTGALKDSIGPGGELDFSKLAQAFNNPLGAASLGAFTGGIFAQLSGGNQAFGSLFGGIGAAAGSSLRRSARRHCRRCHRLDCGLLCRRLLEQSSKRHG